MLKLFLLFGISSIFFCLFLLFLITGIVRKRRNDVFISVVFFVVSAGAGIWGLVTVLHKVSDVATGMFRPRTGMEIYTVLFKKPGTNCVSVINHMDQMIPRIDCCIWLEFKTCPQELNRIIAQQVYESKSYSTSDSSTFVGSYSPRPEWWTPYKLGNTVTVLTDINPEDPNHAKIMIISKDSTHAYYCDMAE